MATEQPIAIIRFMGPLIFDAVFEEQHASELEVTDNPVETGVIVSDHAFMKPKQCTISAGVTNTPLRVGSDDKFSNGSSRAKEAFRLLEELQAKAEPFDVQTGLKLYSNMVCKRLTAVGNSSTENSLEFVAELRELTIVSTQAVTYPPRKAGATKQQADKKTDKGEQQGSDKTKSKSIAKSIKDAVTGGGT